MRFRSIAAAGVAVVSAAVLASSATARPMLTHEVNVTFTKSGCALQFASVSRPNTRIVFHIINNSAAPAGMSGNPATPFRSAPWQAAHALSYTCFPFA